MTQTEFESLMADDVGEYTRVTTPFLYPDGDVIDVFVKEAQGITIVTDLGETLRWLRSQAASIRRTVRQTKLIDDVVLTHGLERFRGMLQARVGPGDSLASVVLRVAQGALRVADVWFTMRTRSVESITDEVDEFLSEKQVHFERAAAFPGRSGRTWKPDFHTNVPSRSSLIFVLSTGSRGRY